EPGAVLLGGVLERVLVARTAGLGGAVEQLPLVVPADDRGVEGHEDVGGLGWLQRPGEEVARDEQPVDVTRGAEVGEDCLERPEVPVDVGDGGDPHGANLAWGEQDFSAAARVRGCGGRCARAEAAARASLGAEDTGRTASQPGGAGAGSGPCE